MVSFGDAFDTLNEPQPGFRFGVFFYGFNTDSPEETAFATASAWALDSRFQKVSGLAAEVETETIQEGGQNLYTQRVPLSINYANLVLERGIVVGPSPLNGQFEEIMSSFTFNTFNVLVTLFSAAAPIAVPIAVPIAAWNYTDAYPVKMSTSDLDAEEPSLLIDTLELAYSNMTRLNTIPSYNNAPSAAKYAASVAKNAAKNAANKVRGISPLN